MRVQVFGALFTKLGVPIPTAIPPKVLAAARELIEGRPCDKPCRELLAGTVVEGRVGKQACPLLCHAVVMPALVHR